MGFETIHSLPSPVSSSCVHSEHVSEQVPPAQVPLTEFQKKVVRVCQNVLDFLRKYCPCGCLKEKKIEVLPAPVAVEKTKREVLDALLADKVVRKELSIRVPIPSQGSFLDTPKYWDSLYQEVDICLDEASENHLPLHEISVEQMGRILQEDHERELVRVLKLTYPDLCQSPSVRENAEAIRAQLLKETNLRFILSEKGLRFVFPEILLPSLKALYVDKNELRVLPDKIVHCKEMTILDCRSNHLIALPEEIGALEQLDKLLLDHNEICFLPESIGRWKELYDCNLHFNRIAEVPENGFNALKAKYIRLHENPIQEFPITIGHKPGTTFYTISPREGAGEVKRQNPESTQSSVRKSLTRCSLSRNVGCPLCQWPT